MKKITSKLANLPTYLQLILNILLLILFSCALIFINNDIIKVITVMILFICISVLFMAMNQGYSIKYKKKMMKKIETIEIKKNFNEFKYYLSQNGYSINKEDSSLLTYSLTKDNNKINISFVDNFSKYLNYLASIKKDDNENEEEKNTDSSENKNGQKLKTAVFVVIFKECNEQIKEYCYNNSFTVEKFGLLFYFYENNTLNSYYTNCKDQNVLDQFNKVIGDINDSN